MVIQLHDDDTNRPKFIAREAITKVYSNTDNRTVVEADSWFFASETVAEVVALWTAPARTIGNEPVLTLKAIAPDFLAKCKAITAKELP